MIVKTMDNKEGFIVDPLMANIMKRKVTSINLSVSDMVKLGDFSPNELHLWFRTQHKKFADFPSLTK